MRIALIHYRQSSLSQIKELLLRIPQTEVTSFLLVHNVLFTEDGRHVSLHDVALGSDVYVLDPHISHHIRENLHHYFNTFSVAHLYGKAHTPQKMSHDFLISKTVEIQSAGDDIERTLATLWTTIPHPVRLRKKDGISQDISSIHELRRQTLPRILQCEHIECVYQPKGRKLTCTLVRNARGRKVYTTPLFERISHQFQDRLSSASLSHNDKEKIIKRLEELFAHYPSLPVLHVELTHTPKGIYLMHAAPVYDVNKECVPGPLHAVGMQSQEILASCLASLSTK